ncbi:MAG: WD40 repeat domain-containing protein, partial [Acidobacteriota bacterium]|nr:WD40 repeat domain-containing protein [Acidobacteriota bacterium]
RTPQARAALRRSLLASHVRRVVGDDLQDTADMTLDDSGEVTATVNMDGVVRVWRVKTGELLATLDTGEQPQGEKVPGQQIHSLVFSHDGEYLAGASHHDALYLWRWRVEKLRSQPLRLGGVQETPEGSTAYCSEPFGCRINTVAFTRDGAHLAAAGERGVISVWETATGKLVRHLSVHTKQINEVLFSPDGRYLASSSDDGRVLLWDWNAAVGYGNSRTLSQAAPDALVYDTLAFDDGGKFLVVAANSPVYGGATFQAEVYEVETGARRATLTGHKDYVNQVSFSRDGRYVLTASDDGTARLWNWSDSEEWSAPVVLRGHDGGVLTAALSQDGRLAVTGGADGTVRVWNSGAGLKPERWSFGNGRFKLVGATQYPLATMWGHRRGVAEARFDKDGQHVLTVGDDVRVWEPRLERLRASLPGREDDGVLSASYSPDGTQVVTTGARGDTLQVWPLGEGGRVGAPTELGAGRQMSLRKPSFSPDNRHIVAANNGETGGGPQEVYVWARDAAPSSTPSKLDLGAGFAHRASFSHDREGRYVVIASGSNGGIGNTSDGNARTAEEALKLNLVRVWDWDAARGARNPVVIGPLDYPVVAADFSYDAESRYVAAVTAGGVRVFDWRADGAPQVAHLPITASSGSYHDVAFSPDGEHLAVARYEAVEVWDWRRADVRKRPVVIRNVDKDERGFATVAFSPDGDLVVTSDMNARVKVWDARTGALLTVVSKGEMTNSYKMEVSASFSPDGTSVLTAGGGGARIYECPECAGDERLLALVSARVTPQQLLTGHSNILLDLEKDEGGTTAPEGRGQRRLYQLFRRRN